ncbi:Short-chain dehydrogenase TIC 32 [Durusdinium trenchii]|uniref:Chloroplastic (Translocon at the inner envelope membrane of chloroplasts 32) (PsTIC32) n=1 Tax=Durusdinium trenchii TaxID=1381693 RepID=A0ABP0LNB3_9DINO
MDGKVRMVFPQPRFCEEDLPDLRGQTALVTGANSGVGLSTARALAKHGAKVVVACRSVAKAQAAKREILRQLGDGSGVQDNLVVLPVGLDLGSSQSVREFASAFSASHARQLDMLVLNAGIMFTPFELSEDGVEMQFMVNHVSHFLLTLLLLPELTPGARVVSVSSCGHFATYPEGIRWAALNASDSYDKFFAYGQSKLANILFTRELAARTRGRDLFVNAAHPGFVATNIQRSINADLRKLFGWLVDACNDIFTQIFGLTPDEGALTQLFLAASPRVRAEGIHGEYWVPTARNATADAWALSPTISRHALDDKLAADLWEFSVKVTGTEALARDLKLERP